MAKDNTKNLMELLDRFQQIDPMGAIVVSAAGIAGLAGLRGPLTTILTAFGGTKDKNPFSDPTFFTVGLLGGPVGVAILQLFGNNQNVDSSKQEDYVKAIGGAASNMVEAGLMYTLVHNPETLKMLMDMAKEAEKGAVGLSKGVGALLG
jgi:hypothetical protein